MKTRRTFEEVISQVRTLLFDGSLKPGDRLPPERELCQTLGIGRPALREALRALEAGGLIESRKGKMGGAFISSGNHHVVSEGMSDMLRLGSVGIDEMFEAREWFMAGLIRPVCQRITPVDIEKLRANVETAERLNAAGRLEERVHANFEFHSLLAEASHNPVAVVVMRGLMDALRSVIREIGTDLPPRYFDMRRSLVKALSERKHDVAERLMVQMLHSSSDMYKRLQQEHADRRKRQEAAPEPAAAPRRKPQKKSAE